MEAIILAGGFGTRLQSVVSEVPKPMAPVAGKPFLTYILDQLKKHGFTRVILAVGYLSEVIENHFGNNYREMEIIYSHEYEPLGTGGCIVNAMKHVRDEYVYVINGDTYFDVNLSAMKLPEEILIACKYMKDASRYGVLDIVDGKVKAFKEKSLLSEGYINGGIYIFKKDIFNRFPLNQKFSLEKDFFEKYMNELNIEAYLSEDYFIDIGIPEDYHKAEVDFK
jgi:D-glycero-alpha-D-manno-heptose 1-phosphate guanylyltransferase